MKRIALFFIVLFIIFFMAVNCFGLDVPGAIIFEKEDGIYAVQTDGRGEKKLTDGGCGPVLVSPDGKKIAYFDEYRIFIKPINGENRLIYQGTEGDVINLLHWFPENRGFVFRKILKDGRYQVFLINDEEGSIKDLGTFYEMPDFSPDGRFWVYSSFSPDNDASEVFGSPLGEEGRYVFNGRMINVLAWDPERDGVLYGINDKIYGYSITSRGRYINNLPFENIFIVGFSPQVVLYYYNDFEERSPGLKMLDYADGDQKELIDKKSIYREVTHNPENDKFVIFIPAKPGNLLGEGDLYLVETLSGEATPLTKDVGSRVFNETCMDNQWSPDGQYFVYEKIKMRFSNVKRAELRIAGEGKDEKIVEGVWPFKHLTNPVWAELDWN